jgi:hypothetical protein
VSGPFAPFRPKTPLFAASIVPILSQPPLTPSPTTVGPGFSCARALCAAAGEKVFSLLSLGHRFYHFQLRICCVRPSSAPRPRPRPIVALLRRPVGFLAPAALHHLPALGMFALLQHRTHVTHA